MYKLAVLGGTCRQGTIVSADDGSARSDLKISSLGLQQPVPCPDAVHPDKRNHVADTK